LIILFNYGSDTYETELVITFRADFRDIFEVRGMDRKSRGELFIPTVTRNNLVSLSYRGLDDIERQTGIQFEPNPFSLEDSRAIYKIKLNPKEAYSINCTAVFQVYNQSMAFEPYSSAFNKIRSGLEKSREMIAEIYTE